MILPVERSQISVKQISFSNWEQWDALHGGGVGVEVELKEIAHVA